MCEISFIAVCFLGDCKAIPPYAPKANDQKSMTK